jgi:hypothetical protein
MGFAADGVVKAAYNHFDSYPEHLGVSIFRWACDADLEDAKAKFKVLEDVDENAEPTPEQIERLKLAGFDPSGVSTGADWYSWLRNIQGDPEATLNSGYIANNLDFATDSLFCEWAYIVDLDNKLLEVYRGFQQDPHSSGRFASPAASDGYYPVRLIATLPLNADLPNDFFLTRVSAANI